MSQNAIQSSEFDFQVESVPSFMQMADGTFAKDGFLVNRRKDNNAVLGKVTDRYGLIQHPDLINAVEGVFAAQGLTNYNRRMVITGGGERMYATYEFRDKTRKLAVGDEVGMKLVVQNSFDGGLRASFVAGILRLVCLNGATTLSKEIGLNQKHGSKISTVFIADALPKAIDTWEKSLDIFDRMAVMNITQNQGRDILKRLAAQKVMSEKVRESVAGVWEAPKYREDQPRNLYNLYNAVTQITTHEIAENRFELSNRIAGNALAILEKATRNSNHFASLIAPLPVELEAVALN